MIAVNIQSITITDARLTAANFNRFRLIVKNSWLLQVFNLLKITAYLQKQVSIQNKRLEVIEQRVGEQVETLLQRRKEIQTGDYRKEIDQLTEQLNKFIEVREQSEYLVEGLKKRRILGDFETTVKLSTNIIESYYAIVRILKKSSEISSNTSDQLAKDSSEYSIATLSEILNGR